MTFDLDAVAFEPAREGRPELVPVIAQHAHSGEVLMMGWADRTALERTLDDGRLWFWSRSRGRLWMKGETSGHELRVASLALDCDRDAVLARVRPAGPACHTGERSCFGAPPTLRALADVVEARRASAADGGDASYTVRLLRDRNLRLKKLGEEATELALACAAAESSAHGGGARVAEEAADLLYHTLVACAAAGVGVDAVLGRLAGRLEDGARRTAATARDRAISSAS